MVTRQPWGSHLVPMGLHSCRVSPTHITLRPGLRLRLRGSGAALDFLPQPWLPSLHPQPPHSQPAARPQECGVRAPCRRQHFSNSNPVTKHVGTCQTSTSAWQPRRAQLAGDGGGPPGHHTPPRLAARARSSSCEVGCQDGSEAEEGGQRAAPRVTPQPLLRQRWPLVAVSQQKQTWHGLSDSTAERVFALNMAS